MSMNRYWARYVDSENQLTETHEFFCEDDKQAIAEAKLKEGFGDKLDKLYLSSVNPIERIYGRS